MFSPNETVFISDDLAFVRPESVCSGSIPSWDVIVNKLSPLKKIRILSVFNFLLISSSKLYPIVRAFTLAQSFLYRKRVDLQLKSFCAFNSNGTSVISPGVCHLFNKSGCP